MNAVKIRALVVAAACSVGWSASSQAQPVTVSKASALTFRTAVDLHNQGKLDLAQAERAKISAADQAKLAQDDRFAQIGTGKVVKLKEVRVRVRDDYQSEAHVD